MEFRYGLWEGISALYSESGRQLGEEHTCPAVHNHHIPAESVSCSYDGSRRGKLINVSALRIGMKNFGNALALTDAIRAYHIRQIGGSAQPRSLGIWDLHILSRASIALISYPLRISRQRTHTCPVKDVLASQYQFISGLFMISWYMIKNDWDSIAQNTVFTANEIYDYADQNMIFLSPRRNGTACAGSKRKIVAFLDTCVRGLNNASISEASFDQREPSPELHELVGDIRKWYLYALMTIEMDFYIEMERLSKKQRRHSHRYISTCASIDVCTDISRYIASIDPKHLSFADCGDFMVGALNRQNAILEILGRPKLGRLSKRHVARRIDDAIDLP